MSTNSIGSLQFTRFLNSLPPIWRRHFAIETKPGTDGFAAIATGRFGEPFTIQAESVFANFPAAVAAAQSYMNSTSLTPVTIIWDDINLATSQSTNYMIESVDIESIRGSVSVQRLGVTYSPAWIVMSNWTVRARGI